MLIERDAYGIGAGIAAQLGVAKQTVYRFKRGVIPFPSAKLGELRVYLENVVIDPQADVRALFAECISRGLVRASEIAKRFDVNKSTVSSTVSRFKRGLLPFPEDRLDELEAHLRARSSVVRTNRTRSRRRSTSANRLTEAISRIVEAFVADTIATISASLSRDAL